MCDLISFSLLKRPVLQKSWSPSSLTMHLCKSEALGFPKARQRARNLHMRWAGLRACSGCKATGSFTSAAGGGDGSAGVSLPDVRTFATIIGSYLLIPVRAGLFGTGDSKASPAALHDAWARLSWLSASPARTTLGSLSPPSLTLLRCNGGSLETLGAFSRSLHLLSC